MFPERKKSASVSKNMAFLQQLLLKEQNQDEQALFEAAYTCATYRIVVKRPRLAPKISEHAINFSLQGRSCRFDVYAL